MFRKAGGRVLPPHGNHAAGFAVSSACIFNFQGAKVELQIRFPVDDASD
jgi:hypothetical protein